MSKIFIILGLTILLLVVGFYVFYYVSQKPDVYNISKFNGEIVSIEGNKVTLYGMFIASSTLPVNYKEKQEFSFLVDESTEYQKLEIIMPSYESLRATGKTSATYNLEDLPKNHVAGSLSDLEKYVSQKGIFVEASFSSSVYNKTNPKASMVYYQSIVESQ